MHEARNAIANYEEQSPLYGCIIYRRRKVLIKYIPEGTSRLLQGMSSAVKYTQYGPSLQLPQRAQRSISKMSPSDIHHTRRSWRSP